jgi:hypothetical protein
MVEVVELPWEETGNSQGKNLSELIIVEAKVR